MNNVIKSIKNALIATAILVLTSFGAFAQSAAKSTGADELAYFTNPLFMIMFSAIIILLVLIIVLSNILKGAISVYFSRLKEDGKLKSLVALVITSSLLLSSAYAADGLAASGKPIPEIPTLFRTEIGGLTYTIFYLLVSTIFVELIFVFYLIYQIKSFLVVEAEIEEEEIVEATSILDKFNASVSIEEEGEIMLDHNYDGIRELDNNLPPWWKYGFYLTIVFAFVYIFYFHLSKTGDLQIAEYKKEISNAEKALEEYRKTAANSVDEKSVKQITDPTELALGKEIFVGTCSACHGKLGEGGVGPNFTDEYWLHGGSINDVFKTIKLGVSDKGMKSWQEDFSPIQIAQVASYIKTLKGTNPPNQKAQQGELYIETSLATDSLTAKDSLNVQVKDTLQSASKK